MSPKKLAYWNMYKRQLPLLWTGQTLGNGEILKRPKPPQLVRVVGYQHSDICLRSIYETAHSNQGHRFLVFGNRLDSFENIEFPRNVLPVLQIVISAPYNSLPENKVKEYKSNVDRYLELCSDRGVQTPTVSVFCTHIVHVHKDVKWLLLSGTHMDCVRKNIVENKGIPIYVEQYKHSSKLPRYIRVRQVPELIETTLHVTPDFEGVNDVKSLAS
jgi:hypothetical protein